MSKSDSHQFKGTKGQRIAQGYDPKKLKEQVVSWAEEVISRMPKNISKKKRNKFNTACVVFDEKTGLLYFGRNGGIDRFKDSLHPTLKDILPKKPLNDYPSAWNCAESDAINQALKDGVKLENMRIYVISVRDGEVGNAKESCENCKYAFKKRISENYTGWVD